VTYWTFRLMIGFGTLAALVALWALWAQRRGRVPANRWLVRAGRHVPRLDAVRHPGRHDRRGARRGRGGRPGRRSGGQSGTAGGLGLHRHGDRERVLVPVHPEDHDLGGRGDHPIVLLYQGWTYWVFRRRIGVANIPD
jgi:hypothetical protein